MGSSSPIFGVKIKKYLKPSTKNAINLRCLSHQSTFTKPTHPCGFSEPTTPPRCAPGEHSWSPQVLVVSSTLKMGWKTGKLPGKNGDKLILVKHHQILKVKHAKFQGCIWACWHVALENQNLIVLPYHVLGSTGAWFRFGASICTSGLRAPHGGESFENHLHEKSNPK